MLKVAIVGASGYTGGELLRLLYLHPHVEVAAVTSERSAGKSLSQIFPNLKGCYDLTLQPLVSEKVAEVAELIFTALPHGKSVDSVADFIRMGRRVVDLSADFRLKDPDLYNKWYGFTHSRADLLDMAVYGLPELYRKRIKKATLIANPGCYATASILALAPLVKNGFSKDKQIFIDAKSGISGAGRGLSLAYHFAEANEGIEAYKIGTHRHTPEIEQVLTEVAARSLQACFVPHIIPVNRGLLCTVYVPVDGPMHIDEVVSMFRKFYDKEPFVKILDPGMQPNIRDVRGANYCEIGVAVDNRSRCVIITSAIDNLVKGASGAAIQNMNIMMGFEETTGLMQPGIFP